jgi:adenosine deaminase
MPHLNGDLTRHPARRMIEEGLAVTFCTDNALVSHTDMVRELTLATEAFGLSPGQLRNVVYNGFKRSFMAMRYTDKRDYNRRIISYYERVEREFELGGKYDANHTISRTI